MLPPNNVDDWERLIFGDGQEGDPAGTPPQIDDEFERDPLWGNYERPASLDPGGLTHATAHLQPLDESSPPMALSLTGSFDGDAQRAECVAQGKVPQKLGWPDSLGCEAFHGLAGELVQAIEPHSEADPAAILIQFLVGFGNIIGRTAYFQVEADRHFMNMFMVLVGQSAKGRKGVALGQVLRVLERVDARWTKNRVVSGLSSGEGLIWAVRDEIRENHPVREENGRVADYQEVISDRGERDKRLMVRESEFARVLQVAERESNTLSATIRDAWDTGNLQTITKKQAAHATDAHISIIGHITKDELKRFLTDTASANGFANRFLWVLTKRSKLLPEGGALEIEHLTGIIQRLRQALGDARNFTRIERDREAREMWVALYRQLTADRPGLLGAVTSRAEAQVMRLSCIYALLDGSPIVKKVHLQAGHAVWRYCEDSARYVFGDSTGDNLADEILQKLRQTPDGMTRTEIREHFRRNKSSEQIGGALGVLQDAGLARVARRLAGDQHRRPTEWWFAGRSSGSPA